MDNILKILSCQYIKTVTRPEERVGIDYPEVCFIGRSNAGKSSMINKLVMKKTARIGSTPGVTKVINLYRVVCELNNKKELVIFSDFPGFGYAKVSKKTYGEWRNLIETYLEKNGYIKLLVWVFDIRREMDDLDVLLLTWMKNINYKHAFVLTKTDKVSRNEVVLKKKIFLNIFNEKELFLFSAKDGFGREEILSYIIDSISLH